MKSLTDSIKKEKYKKIKFKVIKTNHLLISATINGVKGKFILDTGASNSCVDFENVPFFKLNASDSPTKAAGAGAIGMLTQVANKNILKIGKWTFDDFALVVFDLSHVNAALLDHKAKPVQGIIGADVLLEGKAVIDYRDNILYLK